MNKKGSNPPPPDGLKKPTPPPPPPTIKVFVKKEDVYHFTINELDFTGFYIESEWEGFKKLKNSDGLIIIADFNESSSMIPFFVKNLFFKDEGVEVTIIKASPSIFGSLKLNLSDVEKIKN